MLHCSLVVEPSEEFRRLRTEYSGNQRVLQLEFVIQIVYAIQTQKISRQTRK
jgi:hypothetical protein